MMDKNKSTTTIVSTASQHQARSSAKPRINAETWKQNSMSGKTSSGGSQERPLKEDLTIKQVPLTMKRNPSSTSSHGTSSSNHTGLNLSKNDLLRLIAYMEGELQARDIAIATLKVEKVKQLMYQAKFGRLSINDPLAALQRDSDELYGAAGDFDEKKISDVYDGQMTSLERLIKAQRDAHTKAQQVLAACERRHRATVRELEQEREKAAKDSAQGDDLCALLTKERERLTAEIAHQHDQYARLQAELDKCLSQLQGEKDRHKAIVLFLVQERKQMAIQMAEMRNAHASTSQTSFDDGRQKKEINDLRRTVERERQENQHLRQLVKAQEEDIASLHHDHARRQPATYGNASPRSSDAAARWAAQRTSVASPQPAQAAVLTNPNFRDYTEPTLPVLNQPHSIDRHARPVQMSTVPRRPANFPARYEQSMSQVPVPARMAKTSPTSGAAATSGGRKSQQIVHLV